MHWIDHDFLPAIAGTVERFVVNPRGEIDGLILAYDTDRFLLVHVPPHLDGEIAALIKPGDAIHVRGLRPRGADTLAAVVLTATNGAVIVDNGPDDAVRPSKEHAKAKRAPMDIAGIVRMSLHGPKGDLRGALLEDGSVIRVGPKEAKAFADLLRPCAAIAARGEGLQTPHGRVIEADEVGTTARELRPVKAPKHASENAQRDDAEGARGSLAFGA